MSVKITKTGIGNEDESLLFEFKDFELPERITYNYKTNLGLTQFINLQTNQINGTFLQPIQFAGKFIGTYVDPVDGWIDAKQRASQLERLQGRQIKLFLGNIKTIAIIEELKINIANEADIEYDILFRPNDITNPIKPSTNNAIQILESNILKANLTAPTGVDGEKDVKPKFNDDINLTLKPIKIPETIVNPKLLESQLKEAEATANRANSLYAGFVSFFNPSAYSNQ